MRGMPDISSDIACTLLFISELLFKSAHTNGTDL